MLKKALLLYFITMLSGLNGIANADHSVAANVYGGDGEVIGTVSIRNAPTGSLIKLMLDPGALQPGWHGLHLHQTGECSDTGIFRLSGGHVGKIQGQHGLLNPTGPEPGDLPNIWVAADGSAGYEAFSNLVQLTDLTDGDGSALIIHAGPDDHLTQPIGGAGGRVACAAITSD